MSAVIQSTSVSLPANLGWLAQYPQFIVCQFVDDPARPGKTNKLPIDPRTLKPCDAHDRANWLACNDATTWANHLNSMAGCGGYGIGFVLTAESGIWCLDIDGALVNGQWLPAVQELFAQLPGVAWEYSHSGAGLHGWGRTAFPLPAHETRTDDAALGGLLEFYSRKRFIALGREAAGQMAGDGLPPRLAQLFPALSTEDASALDAEWTHEPHPDWHGPTDDDALIAIAVKSRSKLATLWPAAAKATFKQLWEADADKLGKYFPATNGNAFDESRADLALACHLAFYTGNHWERMAGLMRRSLLNRAKLDRPDYMHRTIGKACAWQKTFYNDGKGVVAGAPVPDSAASTGISLEDFYAYLPQKAYIFVPTRELWVASGVDDAAPPPGQSIKPSEWLSKARAVHQMVWAPGEPMVVPNRLVVGGSGWIEKDSANTFNLYKAPTVAPGDPTKADPWLDLLRFIYPENADHIVRWFAHRRQRPGEKINHALVFGGPTRIGKDTVCEPLKIAVGPWNCREIAPKHLLGEFNPYVKSVVLRVSEARDQGDMSRYALHDHCKTLLAAPPLTLRCNEKNLREHEVFNVVGVIFTTNHKDGLYLPPDDARHYVAWSEREHTDFRQGYWPELYRWYEAGGYGHVTAYLDSVDLSGFNPKQVPEKTPAFWMMVDAGRNPEESELGTALENLGKPRATCISRIAAESGPEFQQWLKDARNRRHMGSRFESAGYVAVRNPDDKNDGLWRVDEKRQAVYVLKELPESQRLAEAAKLCCTKLEANVSGAGRTRFLVVPK